MLDIFPEAEPRVSVRYTEEIIPPTIIRGVWFPLSWGLQDYPYTRAFWKKTRGNDRGSESGSSEAWKVKPECVMFLERNTEMAKGGGC